MTAKDPNATYTREAVTVLIKRAAPGYWYRALLGEALDVIKTTATYADKPDVITYCAQRYHALTLNPGDVKEIPKPASKGKK